jgi:hypothetical protein
MLGPGISSRGLGMPKPIPVVDRWPALSRVGAVGCRISSWSGCSHGALRHPKGGPDAFTRSDQAVPAP